MGNGNRFVGLHDLNPNILISIIGSYDTCYLTIDRGRRGILFTDANLFCRPVDSFFLRFKMSGGRILDHRNLAVNPLLLTLRIRIYLRRDLSQNIRMHFTFLERYWNECRDTEDARAYGYLERKIFVPEESHIDGYWNRPVRSDMIRAYLIHSNFNWIHSPVGTEDTLDTLVFLSWIGLRLRKYGIRVSPSKDEFGLKRIAFRIYDNLDSTFLDKHGRWLLDLPFFDYWSRRGSTR